MKRMTSYFLCAFLQCGLGAGRLSAAQPTDALQLPQGTGWRSSALEASSRASAGQWLTDPVSKCKVWTYFTGGTQSVRWTGTCNANGLAAGEGKVSYRRDGILEWESVIGHNGYVMEEGYQAIRIPAGAIVVPPRICAAASSAPAVVSNDIDIGEPWIMSTAANEVIRLLKEHCGQQQGYYFGIKRENAKADHEAWFTNLREGGYEWGNVIPEIRPDSLGFSLERLPAGPDGERITAMKNRRAVDLQAKEKTTHQQQAAAANTRASAAAKERAAKRAALRSRYGVTAYTSLAALKANAFRFKGNTVALVGTFGGMADAHTATFKDENLNVIALSDVATDRFTGNEFGMVVGKVLGAQSGIPVIKFAAFMPCTNYRCEDRGFPENTE